MLRTLTLVLAALLVMGSAARANPMGSRVDGIPCQGVEGTLFHIHAHLAIYAFGRPVAVPDDVGRPVAAQCLYWLHTHTPDGIIHIESPEFRSFTLGQFFDVWGQPLSKTAVASARVERSGVAHVWVNGRRYTGELRKIDLTAHADITIELGPPFHIPAAFTAWNGQ